jgi:hypothetical protein
MKNATLILLAAFWFVLHSHAQNQLPSILIQEVSVDETNKAITINFDIEDGDDAEVEVFLLASDDGGATYNISTSTASGDLGFPVTIGTGKQIVWPYNTQIGLAGNYQLKLVADDRYQIDIQDIVDQVDSNLLKTRLQNIDGPRHYISTPENLNRCRDTIEQAFWDYGLTTYREQFPYASTTGENIIGTLAGVTQDEVIWIIDGHYDTVNNAPGADDNGSAAVAVMEAARILSQYRFHKGIRFIGFDLEEAGLRGSLYHVDHLSTAETIEGVLNMEMIAYYSDEPNTQTLPTGFEVLFPEAYAAVAGDEFRGNFITNTAVTSFTSLSEAFHNAATQYVPGLRVIDVTAPDALVPPDLLRSDHAPFWGAGLPALMLTDGANFRNPYYHTPNDTIGSLNFTFMQEVLQAVIATAAEGAGLSHSTEAIANFQIVAGADHLHSLSCQYTISPIPARQFIRLKFGACADRPDHLQIIAANGQVVFSQQLGPYEQDLQVSTSQLPKGQYWLRLSDGHHFSSQKIIIQ